MGGVLTFLALITTFTFVFDYPVWRIMIDNPLLFVLGFVLYVIVGMAYATFFSDTLNICTLIKNKSSGIMNENLKTKMVR